MNSNENIWEELISQLKEQQGKDLNKLAQYLTEAEDKYKELLICYQGNYSHIINSNLREKIVENEKDDYLFSIIEDLLNKSLDNLPHYQNNIVYRREKRSSSKEDKNWFKNRINNIIMFPSFLSCSKSNWMEEKKAQSLIFEIKTLPANTNSRDLHQINELHTETEITFKSKTYFKIIKFISKKNKVVMEETKENKNAIIIYQYSEYHDIPSDQNPTRLSLLESGL